MRTEKETALQNARARLQHEIRIFAVGYPKAWFSKKRPLEYPLGRLVRAFLTTIRGDTVVTHTARLLGAELRCARGFTTPEDRDEPSADIFRGLAHIAAEVLHGPVCTDFGGGDRLTAEQVAFLVADDLWPRDGLTIDEWPDIRRVRQRMMLDALDVPSSERGDVLGFSEAFIERHPVLIREAEWALRAVGSGEGFTKEVWAATAGNDLCRGAYFFAEGILTCMPNEILVH